MAGFIWIHSRKLAYLLLITSISVRHRTHRFCSHLFLSSALTLICAGKPIEVLEIGSRVSHTGEVYKVKILCAFGVINPKSGTLAWKIVAIASDDLMANTLADVADVNRSLPGTLEEIREWLRTCHCFLAGTPVISSSHSLS